MTLCPFDIIHKIMNMLIYFLELDLTSKQLMLGKENHYMGCYCFFAEI